MIETISFTGRAIVGLGLSIPASCVVRNETNGYRLPREVLRVKDGRIRPDGTPYQPRPFPAGRWLITEIVDKLSASLYWPTFITTEAWRLLEYWTVDRAGHYEEPTGERFRGYGYAIHHARVRSGGEIVRSNTTLGCINIDDPEDARILGRTIRRAMGLRERVYLDVPPWADWEE